MRGVQARKRRREEAAAQAVARRVTDEQYKKVIAAAAERDARLAKAQETYRLAERQARQLRVRDMADIRHEFEMIKKEVLQESE